MKMYVASLIQPSVSRVTTIFYIKKIKRQNYKTVKNTYTHTLILNRTQLMTESVR